MIDYIKINGLKVGLSIQELLDFDIKVNEKTGEQYQDKNKTAIFKNLLFIITPSGFVKVKGSIHKFANNGEYNNDRFTYKRFIEVVEALKEFISPYDIINSIEFGVNLLTPFDPSIFINNLLASGKRNIKKDIKPGCCFAEAQYNQYAIKIYNKGLQQPTGANILRIELKYFKMENLFKNGLKWSELSNPDTWVYLGTILQKKFSDVVYYDPAIKLNEIPEPYKTIIKTGHNPIFWENLSDPHASRIRKQYQELISKYGRTFKDMDKLISDEIECLVNSDHFLNSIENKPLVNSDLSLYCQISPTVLNSTICKVTGIDISCQKPVSKFLYITGIRFLYENDRLLFEKLKSGRLSKKWETESLEVQFREIAHSIRNEFYNPKHNAINGIKRLNENPVLFDIYPLLSQNKRVLAGI
ncbi:MAG: hypothetical protein WCS03_14240 [Bacteroidota bacterium]